jgi:hypothetical protein
MAGAVLAVLWTINTPSLDILAVIFVGSVISIIFFLLALGSIQPG